MRGVENAVTRGEQLWNTREQEAKELGLFLEWAATNRLAVNNEQLSVLARGTAEDREKLKTDFRNNLAYMDADAQRVEMFKGTAEEKAAFTDNFVEEITNNMLKLPSIGANMNNKEQTGFKENLLNAYAQSGWIPMPAERQRARAEKIQIDKVKSLKTRLMNR